MAAKLTFTMGINDISPEKNVDNVYRISAIISDKIDAETLTTACRDSRDVYVSSHKNYTVLVRHGQDNFFDFEDLNFKTFTHLNTARDYIESKFRELLNTSGDWATEEDFEALILEDGVPYTQVKMEQTWKTFDVEL